MSGTGFAFPACYLESAVAAQMVCNTRRHPLYGQERLPGVQICLRDGTQRVMTYGDADEARQAAYEFTRQAMAMQRKLP